MAEADEFVCPGCSGTVFVTSDTGSLNLAMVPGSAKVVCARCGLIMTKAELASRRANRLYGIGRRLRDDNLSKMLEDRIKTR